MAIDADYKTALEDLVKVQWQLQKHAVEAALEKSKRGGHLWIFFETPVLAHEARIYIYHVAAKLDVSKSLRTPAAQAMGSAASFTESSRAICSNLSNRMKPKQRTANRTTEKERH